MDKSKHLESAIKTHQITKEKALLDKHVQKKNEAKEALEEKYKSNVYSPFNSGSYAKNMAIDTKFDFDLVSPFKRNALGSNDTTKELIRLNPFSLNLSLSKLLTILKYQAVFGTS